MKIVLIMEGGIVQQVLSNEPVSVAVVDYDVEDVEPAMRTTIKLGDEPPEEAFVNMIVADVEPKTTTELYDICRKNAVSEKDQDETIAD
jgi:hypothetical protein